MSNGGRFGLICGIALMSPSLFPDTHSWLTFVARPLLVVFALCALAPWQGE